ncbi:hypothetical protein ACFW04_013758 [Cataglyphis niger]
MERVKVRVAMTRNIFIKFNSYLLRRGVSLSLKLRVVKCYIWPVLLCGVETWFLKVKSLNRNFRMWILRRLLKISQVEHVTNEEILHRVNIHRQCWT